MGKPKNKNKDRDLAEDDSDVDIVQDTEEDAATESKPATKQSKKDKRRKKKDDDWEDDISNELEALSMEANKGNPDQNGLDEEDIPTPVTKKEKKKKKKATHDSDEEGQQGSGDVEGPGTKTQKKRGQVASFQMLMVDSDDTKSESEKEEEEEEQVVEKQQSKQEKKKEKKKKGKEKKTAEDDDLDALLAEIDKPKEKSSKKSKKDKRKEAQSEAMETEETSTSLPQNEAEGDQKEAEPAVEVVKVEPKVVTMEDLEDEDEDDRKKRKKKKGKKEEKDEGDEQKEGEAEEEEGTMKTAAQKRKEKKEREKLKKMGKKKKEGEGVVEGKTEDKPDVEKQDTAEAGPSKEEKTGEEKADEEDEGEEEGGKKKKKEKKKKGEKEEKKKKPKAPVAAIKELLKKQKEEEERLQREEDEQIRKEEEEYQAKLEAKRLEDEKRLKKREKEKLRKQRLKDEGKLLTEKQKQDKRRAMQLIETMKEQGMEIPQKTEEKKKRPVYYDKKKKKQQHRPEDEHEETETTPSPTESPATTPLLEFAPDLEVKVAEETKVTDEVKVTEDGDDDVKDDWDISSDEETEEKESSPEVEVKKKVEVSVKLEDTKQADDDDVDDESEEEDDDDDEEEEEEESSSEEESESESEDDRTPYERAEEKLQKRHEEAEKNRTTDVLRAPVVCVLGHVDTGKTKILDKLRRTNVQDGEAGGITQQIGATNVPHYALKEKTTMCKEFQKKELKLPGLLIIDTPGHESFSNLRSRGSSLCDIAILVVDIMHGLEPQTIESINLLKDRKTPFLVALNKVDRLYQWKSNPNSDIMNTIKRQTVMCKQEFDERSRDTITQLAEQGLNAALFYENKNPKEYISLVPTSAISGDGMGNLVALICELTQTWLAKKVSYSEELHATVMEVKALPGLGTTIDVILVNGKLREGDQIVMAGTEGPIVTQIRGLLMPQPMKELRVKGQYEHHKEVPAAQGVKLIGKDFEKALAGLPLYVAFDDDEVEYYSEELSLALKHVLGAIKLTERGVFVQASTLGSLEALLEFLRTSKIPYAGINIGPVHKRDIMKASVMLEHDSQYAVILAFDVKVEREAQEMADSVGVTIFTADIIYHLQDKFMAHREQQKKQKQEEFKNIAVFPCKLRVLPQFIFNSRDPIVVGVSVEAGFVKNGTPICVPSREFCFLGLVTSVEINHKAVDMARKGQEVCIKIENIPSETPKLYGRHFEHTDMLVSKISRASIDAVKDHFREQMGKPDWALLVELKKLFQIM